MAVTVAGRPGYELEAARRQPHVDAGMLLAGVEGHVRVAAEGKVHEDWPRERAIVEMRREKVPQGSLVAVRVALVRREVVQNAGQAMSAAFKEKAKAACCYCEVRRNIHLAGSRIVWPH